METKIFYFELWQHYLEDLVPFIKYGIKLVNEIIHIPNLEIFHSNFLNSTFIILKMR